MSSIFKKNNTIIIRLGGFPERLKEAIKNSPSTQKRIAKLSGISENTLVNYVQGRRVPDIEVASRLCYSLKISLHWLVFGMKKDGDMWEIEYPQDLKTSFSHQSIYIDSNKGQHNPINEGPNEYANEFVSIHYYSRENEDQKPGNLAFKRNWIEKNLNTDLKQLRVFVVVDDLMETLLFEDDITLIELCENKFEKSGLYLIEYQGVISIRRLQVIRDNEIIVKLDNRAYDSFNISPNKDQDFKILGRLRWIARYFT